MATQLEFDFSDEEPTRPRQSFEFVGTTSVACSFDPAEFRGLTVSQITEEVKTVLSSIKPDVSFFEDDVVLAANELAAR